MLKTRPVVVALMSLAFVLPAFGKTTASTYNVPCSEVWSAVQDTLSNPENYKIEVSSDKDMIASYHVKHSVHVTVTGALRQRANRVSLVPKGNACEMQIVSNYSGFEHNDRDDFRKRVDESLAKPKAATPSHPDKPEASTK